MDWIDQVGETVIRIRIVAAALLLTTIVYAPTPAAETRDSKLLRTLTAQRDRSLSRLVSNQRGSLRQESSVG